MDAFDTDVLIYAATPGNRLGDTIAEWFVAARPGDVVGCGSTVIIPELLIKPKRLGFDEEATRLGHILDHLRLAPPDRQIAEMATSLGAAYGLRSIDAIHLATAVTLQADRFITNNRKDFDKRAITEIDITYPEDLTDVPQEGDDESLAGE